LNTRKVTNPIIDDLEEMKLVELSLDETERKLLQGEVKVQGWIAMIALGILYLRGKFH